MSETDISAWLTKREAAATLGVAEKTLERMSKRGEVQQATRKRRGSPGEVVYHPGDIARIVAEKSKPVPPFVMPPAEAGIVVKDPGGDALRTIAAQLVERLFLTAEESSGMLRPAERVPVAERVFLTFDEAVVYSGLPKQYLRDLMNSKKLGRKFSGKWRIRRTDLEKL